MTQQSEGRVFDRASLVRSWVSTTGGFGAAEVWDASAASYAEEPLPTYDEPFMRMLDEEVPLSADMRVLDIGCGSGIYGLALAERVGRVVGCDLSAKMVEAARARADRMACGNAVFVQGDFRTMELEGPFDLVFAHLTPAVSDAETFEKMVSLSSDWCFMAKPVRRTDAVLHEARRLCGIPVQEDRRDEDFLSAFALAWLDGYTPSVRHYHAVWDSARPLDLAANLYADHLVAPDLDAGQKQIVRSYLESIAEDGVVNEHIETMVVMMGWQVA
ncbi:MAG: class I SAM-dependent methyltransferase [Actinomycetota bacterium]|nr:class I SAM-dependent methyltransferase [Actinomycetota bacterium]